MSASADEAAYVRVLAEAAALPLTEAELAAAAARVEAKRAELLPLHALAVALPAGSGTAVFRAGGTDD